MSIFHGQYERKAKLRYDVHYYFGGIRPIFETIGIYNSSFSIKPNSSAEIKNLEKMAVCKTSEEKMLQKINILDQQIFEINTVLEKRIKIIDPMIDVTVMLFFHNYIQEFEESLKAFQRIFLWFDQFQILNIEKKPRYIEYYGIESQPLNGTFDCAFESKTIWIMPKFLDIIDQTRTLYQQLLFNKQKILASSTSAYRTFYFSQSQSPYPTMGVGAQFLSSLDKEYETKNIPECCKFYSILLGIY